jgi:hypothetical protein
METTVAEPKVAIGTSMLSMQNIAIVLLMAVIVFFVYKKFLKPSRKTGSSSDKPQE